VTRASALKMDPPPMMSDEPRKSHPALTDMNLSREAAIDQMDLGPTIYAECLRVRQFRKSVDD